MQKLLKKKAADGKDLVHQHFGFVQQKIRDDPIVPVAGSSSFSAVFVQHFLSHHHKHTSPANIPSATLTGSGTAVMPRLHPFSVVWSPLTVSAKNSVHVSFGFCPLNAVSNPVV